MEDEHTFSTLAFMKDKLCNRLGPRLNMIVCMFAQEFFIQGNFPYHEAITNWKEQKTAKWCYHLRMGVGP